MFFTKAALCIFVVMKPKKRHPIVYFSLLFVVLASIQTYFLHNTVLLKKNEIKSRAKEIMDKANLDYNFWEHEQLEKSLNKTFNPSNKVHFEAFIKRMQKVNDSLAPTLHQFTEEQFQKTGLKLAFTKQLVKVYDVLAADYIANEPVIIYETNPKPVHNYLLNESKWESYYSASETKTFDDIDTIDGFKKFLSQDKERNFIVNQMIYYDVLNMNQILFKELWGLFLVSVILMFLVLWLYFQSYKKYKQQKAQVLLLHDTIDNISHEFRTPLATLKVASKQIRLAQKQETFDLMDRQVNRLERLLKPLDANDVSGKTITEKQLNAFLQDYIFLYPEIHWTTNVQLINSTQLNASEIETILGNLMENSIKYGGKILAITVCNAGNRLQIKVKDNGTGIAKAEQHKIFDKYYRIATNNIHNVKGLGVGLYLVQKIVKKHQGTLRIKSDLGKGCEIRIEL